MRRPYSVLPEWERWFAWYPVKVWIDGWPNTVWWERLERKWYGAAGDGFYEHRIPSTAA